MSKGVPKIFISYASPDRAQAHSLAKALRARGIEPWMDVEELAVAEDWREKMEDTIRKTDGMVCLVSRFASTSPWVKKEWQSGLSVAWDKPDYRFIPVVESLAAAPPGFLRFRSWIKLPKVDPTEVDWAIVADQVATELATGHEQDAHYRAQAEKDRHEHLDRMRRELEAIVREEEENVASKAG